MQGEGPSLGRRCAFVRLGGCNLSCRWCDTPYTWDWTGLGDGKVAYDPKKELRAVPYPQVRDRLVAYGVPLIVVSGGEPLNQQARLLPLVRDLRDSGHDIEVETNGTVIPEPRLAESVRFNVSPKLAHSGDPEDRRIVGPALAALAAVPGTAFKFVCRTEADLDEVGTLVERYGIGPVWVMPEGRTRAALDDSLVRLRDPVMARGWNLTTRLHIMLWGDRRGV
ncbi:MULTISPECIES: 7-carboxy-7-deazaguanine synthase QueE [Nocardiopsis]|uniref:7-carboxy-7-deazaguanine synthase QueE n=1 Tax=Nocardiopsis TaxID=2013 RepID=UPI0005A2E910|nr:7-carboxy-7-deazaguanine synthase QueE [Nocardiopsis dassonvillei]APC36005.1 7-carboxy-7-deazaguanine synthase QueE [Nocardiopsis dassonvillei]NKY81608.1 7-carboxy-7-deazaguanine synthase QueE [Nocardiopsis dassonvillei]